MSRRSTSNKRTRKSEGQSFAGSGGACDLYVAFPEKSSEDAPFKLVIRHLLDRLQFTGYKTVALTHTIYGRPRLKEDRAETALPAKLWGAENTKQSPSSLTVLRRLHGVVENVSDIGYFTTTATLNSDTAAIFGEYDLVSVSPRNDATFQAACATATAVDIITLEYSNRGLPFQIRPPDVQAAVLRGATFEIPYAAAILQKSHRKALIQTCRDLQAASLGSKINVILGSGGRIFEERDVGALALRTPDDLINLAKTVLRFDGKISSRICWAAGLCAIQHGEKRRFGDSIVADVYIAGPPLSSQSTETISSNKRQRSPLQEESHVNDNDAQGNNSNVEDVHDGADDGYIPMF